jgi:hypothetical protein
MSGGSVSRRLKIAEDGGQKSSPLARHPRAFFVQVLCPQPREDVSEGGRRGVSPCRIE